MCDNQYLIVSHIIIIINTVCHLVKSFGNLCIFGSFPLTNCQSLKKLVFLSPMKHLCIIDKKKNMVSRFVN